MRVCLLTREYPPETGWGGIATFSYHLAQGLKELGHHVEVVSLATKQASEAVVEGITVHRVMPFSVPGEFKAIYSNLPYSRTVLESAAALWQRFQQLHEDQPFDVVDTPELLADGLYPAATNLAPLVIRLYTPHSKFLAENFHNVSANFDHQFVAMLERLAMLQADAITSPSQDLADFVAGDLNYPRHEIRIVPNPIDEQVFSPEGPVAKRPAGKHVLFVGRLEERKGITYLAQAIPAILKACPNAHFTIIGDDSTNTAGGAGSRKEQLVDFLTRAAAIEHVTFLPRVPLSEIPAYYRSADVCVVPSLYDNSPYTCLEAMSCGTPVVGTSGGGTKEYCLHGETGLIVPPANAEQLAAAVIKLLSDDELAKAMGRCARQRVLDKFQRRQIALDTVAVYNEAIARHGRRAPNLYLKPADQALSDANVFLYSFDKMLYDLLYQQSWLFRCKHWGRMLLARPRLFAARLLLRIARTGSRFLPGGRTGKPAIIAWLEAKIADREQTEAV